MSSRMSNAEAQAVQQARTEGLAAMADLRGEMTALRIEISKLAIALAALPSRADLGVELDKRVDRGSYEVAHKALEAEVREVANSLAELKTRLQGGMQRLVPWLALAFAVIFGGIGTLVSVAGLIYTLTR